MAGGELQLAAYGAQDYNLTGNPQISFFKKVYRQYTNFSMESIKLDVNGPTLSEDNNCELVCPILRNADLLGELYFLIEDYDTAEFYFRKSLQLSPQDYLSLYYLGKCYLEKEDYISAAKYFKKSIKIEPDAPKTHYSLALAYNALGKTREVKKQMNIIYMLDQSLYNELANQLEKN